MYLYYVLVFLRLGIVHPIVLKLCKTAIVTCVDVYQNYIGAAEVDLIYYCIMLKSLSARLAT